MARAKKAEPQVEEVKAPVPQVVESQDTKPHPGLPVDQSKDMPEFEGDAQQNYVDINSSKDANLTYAELQARKK